MITLPASLITASIHTKEVFYFSTEKLNTNEPHYFICIKKDNAEIMLFSCCTTKGKKREEYINRKGHSLSTLVSITPTVENGLTQQTWVDCNNVFLFTIDEFAQMHTAGKIEYKGEIDDDYYIQILKGLSESPEISTEIKRTLPDYRNV